MEYTAQRELLCALGRRMWQRGLVAANDGNLSIRLEGDRFLVTPSGVSKGFLQPGMLLLVDGSGNLLGRSVYQPTSELRMHLFCYRKRPDVNGVVHAHPPAATAFACARRPIDRPILEELHLTLGGGVPVAPYGRAGTEEIPRAIEPLLPGCNALLLSNHGALTLGGDLLTAYYRMESLEHTAKIQLNVLQLGGGVPIGGTGAPGQ
ncbi:MAG: class II aldolase/adducin family protein [Oscillospiraceae bacterium]|nr:class II aldolase/adducin family protein [Oscillospiraceae bacterium]